MRRVGGKSPHTLQLLELDLEVLKSFLLALVQKFSNFKFLSLSPASRLRYFRPSSSLVSIYLSHLCISYCKQKHLFLYLSLYLSPPLFSYLECFVHPFRECIYLSIFLSSLLVFNCLQLDLTRFLLPFLSGKTWPVNWKFRRTIRKVSVLLEILAHHQKFSRCIRVAHLSKYLQDPHVFWPSGSRSISQRYGSGSGPGSFPFDVNVLSGMK
jgi:hypothetical protein